MATIINPDPLYSSTVGQAAAGSAGTWRRSSADLLYYPDPYYLDLDFDRGPKNELVAMVCGPNSTGELSNLRVYIFEASTDGSGSLSENVAGSVLVEASNVINAALSFRRFNNVTSGIIDLFYNMPSKLYHRYSEDGGITFSERIEIPVVSEYPAFGWAPTAPYKDGIGSCYTEYHARKMFFAYTGKGSICIQNKLESVLGLGGDTRTTAYGSLAADSRRWNVGTFYFDHPSSANIGKPHPNSMKTLADGSVFRIPSDSVVTAIKAGQAPAISFHSGDGTDIYQLPSSMASLRHSAVGDLDTLTSRILYCLPYNFPASAVDKVYWQFYSRFRQAGLPAYWVTGRNTNLNALERWHRVIPMSGLPGGCGGNYRIGPRCAKMRCRSDGAYEFMYLAPNEQVKIVKAERVERILSTVGGFNMKTINWV